MAEEKVVRRVVVVNMDLEGMVGVDSGKVDLEMEGGGLEVDGMDSGM